MPRKEFRIAEVLLSAGFSFVLAYTAAQMAMISFSVLDILIPSVFFSVLFHMAAHFRKITLIVLGSFSFLFLLILITPMRTALLSSISDFFSEYSHWAYNWKPDAFWDSFTAWLISMGFALPVFMLIRFHAPALVILGVGAVLFFGMDLFNAEYPFVLFWCYLFLFLVMTAFQAGWPNHTKNRRLLTYLPYCLVIVLLAAQIPFASEGWGKGLFKSGRQNGWFDFGFPSDINRSAPPLPDEELGGSFRPGGVLMMRVRTDGSPAPYLKSGAGITYTGRGWLEDETGETVLFRYGNEVAPPYYTDLYYASMLSSFSFDLPAFPSYQYLLTQVNGIDFDALNRELFSSAEQTVLPETIMGFLIETGQLDLMPREYFIVFENMVTDRLLLPDDTIHIYPNTTADSSFVIHPGDWLSGRGELIQGTSYRIFTLEKRDIYAAFSVMPYAALPPTIESGYKGAATDLLNDINPYLRGEPEEAFLETYQAEAFDIYQTYTALPDSLPQRVRDLAWERFGDIEGEYAKAKAIEQYLSSNFPYEIDMPALPQGADFVDYFLFEAQEGYCTYYASAMTVLCRELGLPARYVTGFAPSSELRNGEYYYTDELAHAWCEVYFEGVGWLRFEPTASYASGVPIPTTVPEPSELPTPSVSSAPTPTPSTPPVTPTPSDPPKPSPLPTGVRVLFTVGILAAVFFIGKYTLRFYVLRRRRRFLQSVEQFPYTDEKARQICKRILWMLSLCGIRQDKTETTGEFFRRTDEVFPIPKKMLEEILSVFDKLHYGSASLTIEECRVLPMFMRLVERRMELYMDKPRWILYGRILHLFDQL